MVNRATYKHLTAIGDGRIERDLARQMLSEGVQGLVTFKRGQNVVFSPVKIEVWAGGNPLKTQEQPEGLKRGEK